MEKDSDVLPNDIQRTIGKDAQRNNIFAAKMTAEIIKTTLGPKGMDKMLVDNDGNIIVTNDGVTILQEMDIEHPAAKMMVEIAKTQESKVGDGTTTAVMIAGKLLENAEKLLDRKIHPTVITKGYHMAQEKAQEFINELSVKITPQQEDVLKEIAMTSMTGKGAEGFKEKFAEIIVKAIKQVEFQGNIGLNNIKIEKVEGEGLNDSELIPGVVLDKEKISQDMPSKIDNSKIALIDFPIEQKNPDIDTRVSISSPEQLHHFLEEEEKTIRKIVEKIAETGANVVLCQKGIDDSAQYLLAKKGIYACRRVSKSDLEKTAKATNGKIVSSLEEISSEELGKAELVEEVVKKDDVMTYVRGCENPRAITILIHGGTLHVMDEIERAIKDGLGDVASCLNTGLVVAGGGAIEIELSKKLRKYSQEFAGRERLAIEEFASALEFIPSTLAENAGMDPIDVITELKSKHDSMEINSGINIFTNKIEDSFEAKILEPYKIKSQALASATEVATMILRIDDVIAASGTNKQSFQGPSESLNKQ